MPAAQVPLTARGERVDRFLVEAAGLSRSRLSALIDAGHVQLDGKSVKAAHRLHGGESLTWEVPEAVAAEPQAQDLPLSVLYEDRDIVALDKAAGIVVHPGAGNHDGTLVNALLHHVKDLAGVGGVLRPGLVHRLDKDTTGVMVVAKNDRALEQLQAAFASREVEKTYLGLTLGQPPDAGTFDTLYGRHPKNRLKFSSKVRSGKSAVTHFSVTARFPTAARVEVRLETGRTHQIRVHFADAGFPLLGDVLYGGKRVETEVISRQALHAWRLAFAHPRTGKALLIEAPVPKDFRSAEKQLKAAEAPARKKQ